MFLKPCLCLVVATGSQPEWDATEGAATRFISYSLRDLSGGGLMVAYNFNPFNVDFFLPESPAGSTWHVVADSHLHGRDHGLQNGPADMGNGGSYRVEGLTAVVFIARA